MLPAVTATAGPLLPPTCTVDAPRAVRQLTHGPDEHFFGYFHVTPWSPDGRRLLAHRAAGTRRMPLPGEAATIGVIDAGSGTFTAIARTAAWNWQAGSMLQWLPGAAERIVYNDRRDGRLCGVVRDPWSPAERVLPRPVASVSPDGRWATSIDFERLARARPVVGYAVADPDAAGDPAPADDGLWLWELDGGTPRLRLTVADAVALADGPDFASAGKRPAYAGQPGYEQPGAGGHRIDGAQFSPSGERLLVGHRWPRRRPEQLAHFQRHFWDRLLVLARAGGAPRRLGEDGFHSHAAWIDERRILSWSRHGGRDGLWIYDADGAAPPTPFAQDVLAADPHLSFSPDRRLLLGDSYAIDGRRQLWICDLAAGVRFDLGALASPPPYDRGPIRCDLHPRWSRDGRQVCVDSAHSGGRQMHVIDVGDLAG